MPEPKQKTALMILREKLEQELPTFKNGSIEINIYNDIIYLINTELLAVEKQQHLDTFNAGAKENGEWKETYQNADIYFEINLTLKQQKNETKRRNKTV
jgi:hypothetical protein